MSSGALPRFAFDLEPSADGSSFALYRAHAEPIQRITLTGASTPQNFFAHSVNYQLPHVTLSRFTSVANALERDAQQVGDGVDDLLLYAQVEGELTIVSERGTAHVGPGAVALFDRTRPWSSESTDFSIMLLVIKRAQVPQALLGAALHCLALPAASGGATLLYRSMQALLEAADDLTTAEASAAIDGLMLIAAASFLAEAARQSETPQGSGRLDSALAAIARAIADPALDAARIEQETGLSRSALYRLFQPLGGVAAAIRRQRLNAALKALLSAAAAPDFGGIAPALPTKRNLSVLSVRALVSRRSACTL